MKGDFSSWRFDPKENFNGVLQQQGKVLLDRDWNEQTRITRHWEDTAGRDAIGAQLLAVPVAAPNGFKVESAAKAVIGGQTAVMLTADPGRAWADGLIVYLPPDPAHPGMPVSREATYLQPPVQDPAADVSTLAGGVRDCVVLEVWREALNGFQAPDRLIEPALGGPDTTERIQTNTAFRLWRLAPGDDCHTIRGRLPDDPSKLGKLTVSLQPTTVVPGDCPVVAGGGYTGFEHDLYRIEIADVTTGGPMFKWSQWNGGLVGRGLFDASGTPAKVTITANLTAIVNSGLTQFYLEALAYDPALGHWRVTYGAQATLNNDNDLELGATAVSGSFPTSTDPVFFRLWNGLAAVSDYTNAATPVILEDGIQLVFDAPGAGVFYRPGDFWTFPVRAGEVKNPDTLIDAQPPAGIVYHRVPLAVVTWGPSLDTTVDGSIEDCRRPFRPLAQLDTCCTFRVGDGVMSTGDFTSIQQAVDALPPEGGEVCVLPGNYVENVAVINRHNVTLSGCGPRTHIQSTAPTTGAAADPVILVAGGSNITLECFSVQADDTGTGILIQGLHYLYKETGASARALGPVLNVRLESLVVVAGLKSAVRAERVRGLVIRNCACRNNDETNDEHTVAVLADDALIERNIIEVPAAADATFSAYRSVFVAGTFALGGLQLEGLCDSVRVSDNLIRGGSGHGITLGSLLTFDGNGNPVPPATGGGGTVVIDPCAPTRPAGVLIDEVSLTVTTDGQTLTLGPGGPLRSIEIADNRIGQMGVCGIGVVGFFDLSSAPQVISVYGLAITGNELRGNLRRTLDAIPAALERMMGYGVIGLADATDLVIRDNVIAGNGTSSADPVCGIFVLHATGAEISRNHVLENGLDDASAAGSAAAGTTKTGRRGGIVICHALAPTVGITIGTGEASTGTGFPAAGIHANVVTVPVGPALWLQALGPVSVLGNQFTTRGIVQRGGSATILGAAVYLLDLGLSNELYLQFLAFSAIAQGSVGQPAAPGQTATTVTLNPGRTSGGTGRPLVGGEVLFAGNQVELNLLATGATLTFAAIAILTLDDLGFHGNQCTCDLLDDFVLADAMVFAMSARVEDNRFTEGMANALFSAIVFGFMAAAAGNQATHCLLVRGWKPVLTIETENTILLNAFVPNFCNLFTKLLAGFGSQYALPAGP